jgi:hypothetical protein
MAIVSGLYQLYDGKQTYLRNMVMYQVYNKVFWQSSISPETASEGLYVQTQPRLGLASTPQPASATSGV